MITLPIEAYKKDLIEALKEYQTLIIVGDTGSGKTTQIPQYLLEIRDYRIGVTQPRRIAALEAAKRVSQEMKSAVGRKVGYKFRFDQETSQETRITYLTDGTMVRLQMNASKEFDVLILDEAHERSLDTDILFGLLRRVQATTGIKILIMSATLDIEKVSKYFGDAPVFSVPGRLFQVDIYWQNLKVISKQFYK